jgi:hypothetical protein
VWLQVSQYEKREKLLEVVRGLIAAGGADGHTKKILIFGKKLKFSLLCLIVLSNQCFGSGFTESRSGSKSRFSMTKIFNKKKFKYFAKISIYFSYAYMKGFQTTGEASPVFKNMKFVKTFWWVLCVFFLHPDADSQSGSKVPIESGSKVWIVSGSNPVPDPKHWSVLRFLLPFRELPYEVRTDRSRALVIR